MEVTRQSFGPLACVVIDGGPKPSHPLVLCHGYGAPGDDLADLGEYILRLLGPLARDYRLVFPAAPLALDPDYPSGGRAWWPLNTQHLMELFAINDFTELKTQIPPGLDEARAALTETIQAIVASLDSPGPLAIGGFSQGAMITLDVALRGLKTPPAVLIQYSGTLICESIWTKHIDRLADTHVFQSHGHEDTVLPMIAAQWLGELIRPAAASYTMLPFVGPHTITPEALQATAELLAKTHR